MVADPKDVAKIREVVERRIGIVDLAPRVRVGLSLVKNAKGKVPILAFSVGEPWSSGGIDWVYWGRGAGKVVALTEPVIHELMELLTAGLVQLKRAEEVQAAEVAKTQAVQDVEDPCE